MKKTWVLILFICALIFLGWVVLSNRSTENTSSDTSRSLLAQNNTASSSSVKNTETIKKTIDQQIKEIQILIEQEEFEEAQKMSTQALHEAPNNEELYLLLADIYTLRDQYSNLTQIIREFQKRFPASSSVKVIEAKALFAGDSDQKINDYLSFYSEISNPIEKLQVYEAITYILRNDINKSRDQLLFIKEQLDQKPALSYQENQTYTLLIDVLSSVDDFKKLSEGQNAHLYALIAKILLLHQEPHIALEFCEYALQENNQYIDAYVFKGIALYNLSKYTEAETALRSAYELDPERPGVHYFLALTLEKKEDPEALLFFEKALTYDGFEFSDEVKWKLVDLFTEQKKYSKVQELYEELLQTTEDEAAYEKAITLLIAKDPAQAQSMAEELLTKKPNSTKAQNLLAWTLIQQNKIKEASQILEKLLQKDKEDPQTYLNIGLINSKENNTQNAQQNFKLSYEKASEQNNTAIANWAATLYNKSLEK